MVRLQNFRNHTESVLECGQGVNVLLGCNGQGKTNMLEAISCLGLTKSFYAANDATLIQIGYDTFLVDGALVSDKGVEHSVSLSYVKDPPAKAYTVDGERFERMTSVIGMFPVVVLSPENGAITFGGPADRRKFIDMVLCQVSRSYFDDILEYRHILRQRNRILGEGRIHRNIRRDVLDPWDEGLASRGARITHRRMQLVHELLNYTIRCYEDLVETPEQPGIAYSTTPEHTSGQDTEKLAESIRCELARRSAEELERGMSLVGPHRDDLLFQLGGISLQRYASQGQHKTFLIALKLAEFLYLREQKGETPILLLDDVLSELDGTRSRRLLTRIADLGQTIITATDETPFNGVIKWGDEHRKAYVEQGTCRSSAAGIKEAAFGA